MKNEQEWWEADLAELTSNVLNGDYDSRDEMLKCILSEHRKRVVKEIRGAIESVWSDSVFHQDMTSTLKLAGSNEMRQAILPLPELKED